MSVFAIGDLHLSLGGDKPMDVFPGWEGYLPRLEANWRRLIIETDVVLLAGDTSWAMSLPAAKADFAFLESLPGEKWLIKGNHDYWWTTAAKMEACFAANGFDSLHILHNNCCKVGGTALCGTRGWPFDEPGGTAEQTQKLMQREAGRLRASLAAAGDAGQKLVFLHYPPVFPGSEGGAQPLLDVMAEYGVARCFYAHLHGKSIRGAVQGTRGGIDYRLISADALGFCPLKLPL